MSEVEWYANFGGERAPIDFPRRFLLPERAPCKWLGDPGQTPGIPYEHKYLTSGSVVKYRLSEIALDNSSEQCTLVVVE